LPESKIWHNNSKAPTNFVGAFYYLP